MVESAAPVYVLPEERLKDPLNDRVMPVEKVPLPPSVPLTKARAFKDGSKVPDYELIK